MKTRKTFLLVLGILVLAVVVVVAGIGARFAFQTQPILPQDKTYLLHLEDVSYDEGPGFYLWPLGPDETYETREFVSITPETEQEILDILSRYEKHLSWEKAGWIPLQKLAPMFYLKHCAIEIPSWVEAQVVLYNTDPGERAWFNIVLGDGRAQQRLDYTFQPPFYTIENEEQLYAELAEVLGLKDLLAERRTEG